MRRSLLRLTNISIHSSWFFVPAPPLAEEVPDDSNIPDISNRASLRFSKDTALLANCFFNIVSASRALNSACLPCAVCTLPAALIRLAIDAMLSVSGICPAALKARPAPTAPPIPPTKPARTGRPIPSHPPSAFSGSIS